jgi:hypothetical protein
VVALTLSNTLFSDRVLLVHSGAALVWIGVSNTAGTLVRQGFLEVHKGSWFAICFLCGPVLTVLDR